MAKLLKRPRGWNLTAPYRTTKAETLLDEIKDAIDTLNDIKNPRTRSCAARDLIEYIELHYEPAR